MKGNLKNITGDAARLATANRETPGSASGTASRRMSITGRETLDLYLAEISRNLSALGSKAISLQLALSETSDAVSELRSCQPLSTKSNSGRD